MTPMLRSFSRDLKFLLDFIASLDTDQKYQTQPKESQLWVVTLLPCLMAEEAQVLRSGAFHPSAAAKNLGAETHGSCLMCCTNAIRWIELFS